MGNGRTTTAKEQLRSLVEEEDRSARDAIAEYHRGETISSDQFGELGLD